MPWAAVLLLAQLSSPSSDSLILLAERKIEGVACQVVTIQAQDPRVRLGMLLAQGFPGTDEPFAAMIRRTRPAAAINGAYFSKTTLLPIGDVVVNGELLHSGRMGTVFIVRESGELDIQRVERHRTVQWPGTRLVLGCGPALMLDGEVDVAWQAEGFRDPHVIGRASRMGLGITRGGQLLWVHARTPITFERFARVFRGLGCVEAMNLDSGASQGLYVQGKMRLTPGRRLTTALGVWIDPHRATRQTD